MKKVTLLFLLLTCMLTACGQKEVMQEVTPTPTQESEVIPIIQTTGGAPTPTPIEEKETDKLIFDYDDFSGYVEDITVADDGTLYAICLNEKSKSYSKGKPIRIPKPQQYLYAFDGNGECLWRVETMLPILPSADLSYRTTQDAIMEWLDGFLYIVLPGLQHLPVLYRFNPETLEWQELYYFETFSLINNLVFMGDKAWSLWKYTPAQENWEKTEIAVSYYRSLAEEMLEKSPVCENFAGYEDGCFYISNLKDLCYETPDGTELLRFRVDDISYLETDGTFLYYYYHRNEAKGIRRIRISDLVERFTVEFE